MAAMWHDWSLFLALILNALLVANASMLSFSSPEVDDDWNIPPCSHVWDGVVFVDSTIEVLPMGDRLVNSFNFDCFNVTVDANDDVCRSRYELLLTNVEQHIVNPLVHCTPELPCKEVRLTDLMGSVGATNFTSPRPTKWTIRYYNDGGRLCSEQKVRISLSVLGAPEERLCPVVNGQDCDGHGYCSINTGSCVCHENPVYGYWNCTESEDAEAASGGCTCSGCLKYWGGEKCTVWLGSYGLPMWALIILLASLSVCLLVLAAMSLTLRRYKRIISERESYAPIVETATQPFRVEHNQAPSLRTKLYF